MKPVGAFLFSRRDFRSRTFPSSQRRGGCDTNKMPRSDRSGADGVVSPASRRFGRTDHPGAPASMKLARHPSSARRGIFLGLVLAAMLAVTAAADEGMWTFDNPPVKQLKDKYNFTPAEQWLDHIRLSSVRFNDGGSGSFVSPNGLVITNHHVALGQLQKISNAQRDYVKDGFYAKTQAEELKAPDLELNVLVSMENVTSRVQGAVKAGMTEKQALDARKAEQAKIQKESLDKTGLRSDVVSLYQGGEYWLYRYKKYTDVRIAFAPEQQAAFYGGDPDNFTYPRYDLDMALFRVYENGKPLHTDNYLKWSAKGAAPDELIFISGHPGSTSRQDTMAELTTERDTFEPNAIEY